MKSISCRNSNIQQEKQKKAYVFPYGYNGFVQGVIEYETYLGFLNYQSTFMLDMYKYMEAFKPWYHFMKKHWVL